MSDQRGLGKRSQQRRYDDLHPKLFFLRERSPLNLALLYTFATGEGITLGLLLQSYVAHGLGGIVIDAATTTAAITLAAGAYGATTRRDLAKLGGILFVGLIGVIVAALLALFIHLPLLHLGIAVVAAALFTGFLVYDFNRLANTAMASAGDVIMLAVAIYLDIFNLFLNLLTILRQGCAAPWARSGPPDARHRHRLGHRRADPGAGPVLLHERGGRPRWAVITARSPPSHRASSCTQVDFPAPSPPTSAITVPPCASRFLLEPPPSRPRSVTIDRASFQSFRLRGACLECARSRWCSSRRSARRRHRE